MPSAKRKKINLPNRAGNSGSNNYFVAGIALVALSAIVWLSIFYPVIRAEVTYLFSGGKNVQVVGKSEAMIPTSGSEKFEIVRPVDEIFGIVIPKIGVNSKVVPDVDPEKSEIYQKALSLGAAHALGSKHPGEEGNVFIFAHSGQDFVEANRYNAIFYLLSKMEPGDEIYLFYQNKKYRYLVEDAKAVASEETQYLKDLPRENTLTLMTCWPAGTNWKRLVVVARQS